MTTLTPLVAEYLRGRVLRGEITRQTATDLGYTLAAFDRSFGNRPIHHLTGKAIDRWLETIGHRAPATRREYLSRVRTFCAWLVDQGRIPTDPTGHVPVIRQPRQVVKTWTRPEVRRLLAAVGGDRRARAVILLMARCACRCVEVARLNVEDFDADARTIRLVGKALHERTIPVPAEAAEALDAYLDEVGRRAGPLIRNREVPNAGLSPRTISAYIRRWAHAAGVKAGRFDGRSAHGLRRTSLSDLMDESGDIRIVQTVAGHAHAETTVRSYLRPVPLATMRTAMEGRHYSEEPDRQLAA